jgi:hypothetical protein
MIKDLTIKRFVFIALILTFQICSATITVNSVHTTVSTCPNNGTATIFASSTSDSAVFLYNIISGPVTYPLQNDSVFYSLYPGTYTARVHDVNSFDSTQVTFTITGNYQAPLFNPTTVTPVCGNTGEIIGNPNISTGLGPYTWQIISPFIGTPQASDTFSNMAPGSYTVKLTDACNVSRTNSVTVNSGGSGLAITSLDQLSVTFIGCDSAIIRQTFDINKQHANTRLRITVTTRTGTSTKTFLPIAYDTTGFNQVFVVYDTVFGSGYDDYLRVCLSDTDSCGGVVTVCNSSDTINPFRFDLIFTSVHNNCHSGYSGAVNFQNTLNYIPVNYDRVPLIVTVTNASSHAVVDSFSYVDSCFMTCSTIPPLAPGQQYILTVRNRCGDFFRDTITWPTTGAPVPVIAQSPAGCLDSTGMAYFYYSGYGSGVSLEIVSGPPVSQSTKHLFAYRDTLIYPMLFTNLTSSPFVLDNVPAGQYVVIMSDTCGNSSRDTFNMTAVQSAFVHYYNYNNCSGLNTLIVSDTFSTQAGGLPVVGTLYTIPGHQVVTAHQIPVFLMQYPNIAPGKYLLEVVYGNAGGLLMPGNSYCWTAYDTLTLPGYNDSIIKATDVATCNGTIYIHVEVDSANGVLPFQYEIINGPETFLPQDSANFVVHTFGTYLIGVIDSCGNVDTRQITIDTGRFEPVARSGGLCEGSAVKLWDVASPYFTYVWQKPNGTFYTGDTLNINPLTAADTGVYNITKIVQINSCRDTAYGTYHMMFKDTFQQSVSLCRGDTLRVGQYWHTTSGIYYDTLSGAYGCDSIVVSNLNVDSIHASITPPNPVCHVATVTLTASGGTIYRWSPGNETTASITINPNTIAIYTVTVSNGSNCSASASVTVIPILDSTVIVTETKPVICAYDSTLLCATTGFVSYIWNNSDTGRCIETQLAGNYYVTATDNNGCTVTSNHVSVTVLPVPPVSITVNGDTLRVYNTSNCQWYFDGSPIPGATSPMYIATQQGDYQVQVTDSNGCTSTSNKTTVSVGVEEISTEAVRVYPNPNGTGTWQLEVSELMLGSNCEVYDAEGKIVYEGRLLNNKSSIGLNVSAGVYVLKLSSKQKSYCIKLIQF